MSDLPPLPEPEGVIIVNTQALRGFTADQMREYALAAVAAERAACARLIERYPEWVGPKAKEEIAAAIRAR